MVNPNHGNEKSHKLIKTLKYNNDNMVNLHKLLKNNNSNAILRLPKINDSFFLESQIKGPFFR